MAGPLAELEVLDLSTMVSGPFTTNLLADFGADVIAVEHPSQPNPIRDWEPGHEGESLWWSSIGRNKRCITLDLSTEPGQELALDLAADVDVVVENFRPGTLERWGLDYETFKDRNEGVILVRISGYGQTGPRSEQPGFGSIAEAISGWAAINGFPDREPLLPPIPLADMTAAQFAVMATMFAIYERDVVGSDTGQVVDVSLYEPLFRLLVSLVEAYDALGETRRRTGNRSPNSAPRNMYATADGYIALSASSQRIFENVARAIDRPDLIEDPRFASNEARLDNVDRLDEIIEDWTRHRTTETVIEAMEAADAIVGPVYDAGDILKDDQYRARETVTEVMSNGSRLITQNVIPTLSRTDGAIDHLGPAHGEHNETIYLDELGIDPDRFASLKERRVI